MSDAVAPREEILEPSLPIVDPHHHLWDRRLNPAELPPPRHGFENVMRLAPRYLWDELFADMTRGHNVRATVFVQCGSMYRADGPVALRPVGETEFVNGVAAMSASGVYGDVRACAGIVGHVDLTQSVATVSEVLQAHILAGGGRFRGIRHSASWDADPEVLGPLSRGGTGEGLYRSPAFRRGYRGVRKAFGPVVRSLDARTATPGPHRSGPRLSGHRDRARPRRHAAGHRRLQGPAR